MLAVAVVLATGQTLAASSSAVYTLLCWVLLLHFAAFWLYGRLRAGQLLLNCSPHPNRGLMLLVAAYLIGQALWDVAVMQDPLLWDMSIGTFFLLTALGRWQVRENGIWEYGVLLRWHRIVSYSWTNGTMLNVQAKGSKGYLRRVSPSVLSVAPEQLGTVDALLARYAPHVHEP